MKDIVTDIVAQHATAARITARKSAESEARNLLVANLGNINSDHLAQLFRIIDRDFWDGKSKQGRFGVTFQGSNAKKICSQSDKANEWIKAFWQVSEEKVYDLIGRFMKEKPIKGAGYGFPSLILYLRDPQKFNMWLNVMMWGLDYIEGRTFSGALGEDYRKYNQALIDFRIKYKLEPQALDIVVTRIYNEHSAPIKERNKRLGNLKTVFKNQCEGFVSFIAPGQMLQDAELTYKRTASQKTHELLDPYVQGTSTILDDEEGKNLAKKLFGLTNFLNWRDLSYISDDLFSVPGRWKGYVDRVITLLGELENGNWEDRLTELIAWLNQMSCKANITKLITTYPLFFWDPTEHIFIKPDKTDQFLKALGEKPLGFGKSLTTENYKQLLELCKWLREVGLVDLQPQDNIDIHSFIWVVTGEGSKDTAAKDKSFWWVNQGSSYDQERGGNYIFAPLADARGVQPPHWSAVGNVKHGDIIIHYAKGELRAVSKVLEEAIITERPGDVFTGEQGLLVTLKYTDLTNPLPLAGITENQRIEEKGPFDINGEIKEGYLFPLSLTFMNQIKPLLSGVEALFDASEEEGDGTTPEDEILAENIIYCGPPGTGKTFLLQGLMKTFIDNDAITSKDDFLSDLVRDLTWWEVAVLTLLDLKKAKVAAIMNHEIVAAKIRTTKSIVPSNTMSRSMNEHAEVSDSTSRTTFEPVVLKRIQPGEFELIDDKVINEIPQLLDIFEKYKNFAPTSKLKKRYEFITFHQSYSYEDFIEGIRPKLIAGEDSSNAVGFALEPGVFKRICKAASDDPYKPYALFIDEINRGNISKIFGELITLVELDKRVKPDGSGLKVRLPYSPEEFGVPANLSIIGTMNTADRSIAFIDIALRRRFQFKEMMPDLDEISKTVGVGGVIDGVNVRDLLDKINRRIEFLYDRDHTIGHSFFLKCVTHADLKKVFLQNVIPLLQEYFYGDWEKICLVLGCGNNGNGGASKIHRIIKAEKLSEKLILGFDHPDFVDSYRYDVDPEFIEATGDELKKYLVAIYQGNSKSTASVTE